MNPEPPCFPDLTVRDEIQDALKSAGYDDTTLRDRLGAQSEDGVRALGRSVLAQRVEHINGPLRALLELFLLGTPIDDGARDVVGADAVSALLRAGLVQEADGALHPCVQLFTIGDLVIASDVMARHAAGAEDFVVGPFGATRALAAFVMARGGQRVLDLGCGTGVLGALAAPHAECVVATDVSARAVAFSRFNAALNGLDGMDCRVGSLFEPVAGERFDLIVCNPPYVLSPERRFAYRDGGADLSRQIVSGAVDHLTEGGCLQMMLEWPQGAESERNGAWRDAVTEWLAGSPCDAWLLRLYQLSARDHALLWLRQEHGGTPPREDVERWMVNLGSLGADSVGGGLLVLRNAQRAAPLRTLRDAPEWSGATAGVGLTNWIAAQSLAASTPDPDALLDVPLRAAPGLVRTARAVPSGEGWDVQSSELRLADGLRFSARVDPVAEEIVSLLDGARTPRQALELFAAQHSLDAARLSRGLPGALVKLLRLGLVLPVGDDTVG